MPVKWWSRESAVETELMERVWATGGICDKVRCIGRRGYFDRIVVLRGGRIIFVELKRPRGGRISPQQRQLHTRYSVVGAEVAIVRSSADIDRLLGDQ